MANFPTVKQLLNDPLENIKGRIILCRMAIETIQGEIKNGREDTENALQYYQDQEKELVVMLERQTAAVQAVQVQEEGAVLDDQKPKPVVIGLKPAVLTIKAN